MDSVLPLGASGAERPPERTDVPPSKPAADAGPAGRRVVVEPGENRWTYVIKSVDTRTGESVTLWPRADAVKALLKQPGIAPPASVLDARI
jgi:hypothetical protein